MFLRSLILSLPIIGLAGPGPAQQTVLTADGIEGFKPGLVAEFYGVLNSGDVPPIPSYKLEGLQKYGKAISYRNDFWGFRDHYDRKDNGLVDFRNFFVGVKWQGYVKVPVTDNYVVQVQHYQSRRSGCTGYIRLSDTDFLVMPNQSLKLKEGKGASQTQVVMVLEATKLYPLEMVLSCVEASGDGKVQAPLPTNDHEHNGYRIVMSGIETGKAFKLSGKNTFHPVDASVLRGATRSD